MKKWILLSIVLLLIVFILGAKIYTNTIEPLKQAENEATKRVLAETEIVTIEDFSVFYGQEAYSIVKGQNDDGESLIAWVNKDNVEEEIVVLKEEDGISKEKAIEILQKDKNPQTIIRVTLGMEQNIPIWEIFYRSENDLINYYYLDFKSGKMIKNIQNL